MSPRFPSVLRSRPYFAAALSGLLFTLASVAGHAATITVTDGSTFVGANTGCSIARAMTYLNAGMDTNQPFNYCQITGTFGLNDTLVFAPGVTSITVTNNNVTYIDIPAISKPLVIDGNSGGAGRVEIKAGAGAFVGGLRVNSNNVTIRNMAIHGFYPAAIDVGAFSSITIQGNYLGLGLDGTNPTTGNIFGVSLHGSSQVLVGGNNATQRNVIGMQSTTGIMVSGSDHVQILGNYIGIAADGYSDVGNCSSDGSDFSCGGINVVALSHDIQIGSEAPGTGNVISLNHGDGIHIAGNGSDGSTPSNVSISGNLIGVAADGFTPRPNGGQMSNYNCGIKIFAASDDVVSNTIGGTQPGAGNVIANSPYCGVIVFNGSKLGSAATNIADIEGNAIFGNGTLAVDLSATLYGDGVTGNDANGHAGGANLYQNSPILAHTWRTAANKLYVTGALASSTTPNQMVRVEVFATGSGGNQGERYLGNFGVVTNGSGMVSFKDQGPFDLPVGPTDIILTVTTDNGTSEYSPGQAFTASSDIIFANSMDSEAVVFP